MSEFVTWRGCAWQRRDPAHNHQWRHRTAPRRRVDRHQFLPAPGVGCATAGPAGSTAKPTARIKAATRVVRMAPPDVDRNTVDAGSLRWPPYATVILRPPSASADSDAFCAS